MKRQKWAVIQCEAYEPSYEVLVTYDKEWAEWLAKEWNNETGGSYVVNEVVPKRASKPSYKLVFSFDFEIPSKELVSCEVGTYTCDWDNDSGYKTIVGRGRSYAECLVSAKLKLDKWLEKKRLV